MLFKYGRRESKADTNLSGQFDKRLTVEVKAGAGSMSGTSIKLLSGKGGIFVHAYAVATIESVKIDGGEVWK